MVARHSARLFDHIAPSKPWVAGLTFLLAGWLPLGLQAATPITNDERIQIFDQAQRTAVAGPADVKLAGQAVLHLPAARGYVAMPLAGKVLEAMGSSGADVGLQGIIFPSGGEGWLMTVRFVPAGYVKDDDARLWNIDELLTGYRKTAEATNADRVKRGEPAVDVIGWAARPVYDPGNHRLAYAVTTRVRGLADSIDSVSLDTFALGREGYVAMNMVTRLDQLQRYGPSATALLEAIEFDAGKRYGDADASSDRQASHGVSAIVTGVTAQAGGAINWLPAGLGNARSAWAIGLAVAAAAALWALLRRRKPAGAGKPAAPRA